MLFFQARTIAALAMMLFVNVSAACQTTLDPKNSLNSSQIRIIIKALGSEADPASPFFESDAFEIITEQLSEVPHEAAALLVKELRTVSPKPVCRWEARSRSQKERLHIAWCLRALRFLTGKEFLAKTQTLLPKFRFLDPYTHACVQLYESNDPALETKIPIPFCREWPSRGLIYFAPIDAQEEIIKQWREWYKKEGRTFTPALLDREEVDWVY